jgi:hypothetical protein
MGSMVATGGENATSLQTALAGGWRNAEGRSFVMKLSPQAVEQTLD